MVGLGKGGVSLPNRGGEGEGEGDGGGEGAACLVSTMRGGATIVRNQLRKEELAASRQGGGVVMITGGADLQRLLAGILSVISQSA